MSGLVDRIERGNISSYEQGRARVTVPERSDAVTQPLFVSAGALDGKGSPPPVGTQVVFVEFSDGDGAILARME